MSISNLDAPTILVPTMRFLPKNPDAIIAHQSLTYPADRNPARKILTDLQKGFCAYSERFLKPLDSVEVEHFDPRLKGTDMDGIHNWHAVIRWMNAHKSRRISDFEPLPDLKHWSPDRVSYERGGFICNETDRESMHGLTRDSRIDPPSASNLEPPSISVAHRHVRHRRGAWGKLRTRQVRQNSASRVALYGSRCKKLRVWESIHASPVWGSVGVGAAWLVTACLLVAGVVGCVLPVLPGHDPVVLSRCLLHRLSRPVPFPQLSLASRRGWRRLRLPLPGRSQCPRERGLRKVRTPQGNAPHASGGREPRGTRTESTTENTPPMARKGSGKGEMVG